MPDNNPAKRVPKSLGTETKLLGSYTLADAALALFPGVLVVLGAQLLVPSSLTVGGYAARTLALPFAVLAIAGGALFVYLTPEYTSSLEWLGTFIGYRTSDRTLEHHAAGDLTLVERIHPGSNAIERTDGAMLGLVQVDPPSMALATEAAWRRTAEGFEDFLNTTAAFPIQIYSTTRPFPVGEYLSHYEARFEDADVRANPRLAALIEHYLDWYERDLEDRRMTIRDHYVIIAVTPEEIQFEQESLVQRLADVPIAGIFVSTILRSSEADEREALLDALGDRLSRVEAGLRELEGCSARIVDVHESAQLVATFWESEAAEYDDMNRVIRTSPLIGGGS
jgi:hypothetical protein